MYKNLIIYISMMNTKHAWFGVQWKVVVVSFETLFLTNLVNNAGSECATNLVYNVLGQNGLLQT